MCLICICGCAERARVSELLRGSEKCACGVSVRNLAAPLTIRRGESSDENEDEFVDVRSVLGSLSYFVDLRNSKKQSSCQRLQESLDETLTSVRWSKLCSFLFDFWGILTWFV